MSAIQRAGAHKSKYVSGVVGWLALRQMTDKMPDISDRKITDDQIRR